MPTLLDGCADAIIADLPYGTTACKWDTVIPFEPLWVQYKRLIKRKGAIVLFGSQPFTSALVMSNVEWFKYCWVWDKALSSGHLNVSKKPLNRHDDLLVFSPSTFGNFTYHPQMETRGKPRNKGGSGGGSGNGQKAYSTYGASNAFNNTYHPTTILRVSNADRNGKVHPTQKPVALLEYLVRTYTNEGETVLDNTMGSGTTGVACVKTGRNFIGIEKLLEHFETAKRRIEKAQNTTIQLELEISHA
jgi:site-specific DNA-methyltransferase (adenine-specific)